MSFIKLLDRNSEKIVLIILLTTMLVINSLQIFFRFVLRSSFPWVEELSRYLLMWSGFMGVSYTIRYNTIMRLTLIFAIVPRKTRNYISLLCHSIMLAFFVWVTVISFELLALSNQRSSTMEFPIVYVYFCSSLCGILSSVRCIQGLVRVFRNFKDGDDAEWDPRAEIAAEQQSCKEAE